MARAFRIGDRIFRGILFIAAATIVVIVASMIVMMFTYSMPTIERFGLGFLTGREWNPSMGSYGALPFIYGTVVS